MKFDLLFQTLLKENLEEKNKKRYKVSCFKYGISKETTATSPAQAIAFLASTYAKSKGLNKEHYGRIISDFKKCANVKEIV
jgi:hypothetical protein